MSLCREIFHKRSRKFHTSVISFIRPRNCSSTFVTFLQRAGLIIVPMHIARFISQLSGEFEMYCSLKRPQREANLRILIKNHAR